MKIHSPAVYISHILTLPTREKRLRALAKVPPHLRGEVERRVKELWPQREGALRAKAQKNRKLGDAWQNKN